MDKLDRTEWLILNATADDCECLEQIYLQVCYELRPENRAEGPGSLYSYRPIPEAPLLSEIADRIRNLVERGLLTAVREEEGGLPQDVKDLAYVWRAWFEMTPRGRSSWETSEHASLVEQE